MLDENRIKQMTRLASYEEEEGKKAMHIVGYYRSDYVGYNMLKTAISITIGYMLILLLWAGGNLEYLLNNIHRFDLLSMGKMFLLQYIALLVFYAVIAYVVYSIRYARASKSVKQYAKDLSLLQKMYGNDEKKHKGTGKAGGKRK